jgi:hypothetical protein
MKTEGTSSYVWQDQRNNSEELYKYLTRIRFSYACVDFSAILTLFFCDPAPTIASWSQMYLFLFKASIEYATLAISSLAAARGSPSIILASQDA